MSRRSVRGRCFVSVGGRGASGLARLELRVGYASRVAERAQAVGRGGQASESSSGSSCAVLPQSTVLNAGASRTFSLVTLNAGVAVAYEGPVTWGVAGIDANPSGLAGLTEVVTGGTQAGSGTITATIDSTVCSPAVVRQYAAPASGQVRVTVVTAGDETPLLGATVVIDGVMVPTLTGPDGSVAVSAPGTPRNTISVFQAGFVYVTVIHTLATDILIPLKASPAPVTFSGALIPADFNSLSNLLGTVHFAVSGPSMPGNLMDVDFSTLLGPPVPTMINLGGTTQENVNLPTGVALGLGTNMFKGTYGIEESLGYRALWSLEGNVELTDVLGLGSELSPGGTANPQEALAEIVPALDDLQSAVVTGVDVTPDLTAAQTTLTTDLAGPGPALVPDTPLRIQLNATLPSLPEFEQDDGTVAFVQGAFVLAGAWPASQGFVPLGLTAGVAPTGRDTAGANTIPNPLLFRMAPRHGGLETAPYAAIAYAAQVSQWLGATPAGADDSLVESACVLFPTAVDATGETVTTLNFGTSFLGLPDGMTISEAARELSVPADITGATFHRLDVGTGAAEWMIYFPTGESSVTVPVPPAGFADFFAGVAGATPPRALVQSVSLGYGHDLTYDAVVTFGALTLDDLSTVTDGFSTRQVPRQ